MGKSSAQSAVAVAVAAAVVVPDVSNTLGLGIPCVRDDVGSALVVALEGMWAAIRRHHPDVPAVVITLATGWGPGRRKYKFGHFCRAAWVVPGGHLHEVVISGEHLVNGGKGVGGTLVHEAGHGMAEERGVKDTSNKGRHHNKKFRAIAEELGLTAERMGYHGYANTGWTEAALALYADELAELDAAIIAHRWVEGDPRPPEPNKPGSKDKAGAKRGPLKCTCECGLVLRISSKRLSQGAVLCGPCGSEYEPQEHSEDQGGGEG